MRLTLLAVGRFGRTPEAGLARDYIDRANASGRALGLHPVDLVEVEGRKPGKASEGEAILAALGDDVHLVACDEHGAAMTSRAIAQRIAALRDGGTRRMVFAIGGADGLAPEVLAAARDKLAFGPQTWPHALARVMLAEQLYRAVTILAGRRIIGIRAKSAHPRGSGDPVLSSGVPRFKPGSPLPRGRAGNESPRVSPMRRFAPLLFAIALAAPAGAQGPAAPGELDKEIEKLRSELVKLGAQEQAGEGAAISQRARLMKLNAQEAAIRAKIDVNRSDLAKLLAALQTYQRRPPPPLLVTPRSAKDAVRAAILIRAIAPALEARGKVFAEEAEAIAKVRRSAAAASETLFQAESDIADRRAEIDRLTAQKQGLERAAYADDGRPDAETRATAARAGSVEELVSALHPPPPDRPPPANAPDHLSLPVQGVLMRRFGDPVANKERSQGWTWRAGAEAAVVAPAPGRVEYAGPLKGWDAVVILNVGGGRRVVLAGLSTVSVGVGRSVAAGEPVGRLGPAGDNGKTPPELYLEVRGEAGALDPGRWLKLADNSSAQIGVTNTVRR